MTNQLPNLNRVRIDPSKDKYSLRVIDIPLSSCRANPNQPRKYFDEAALQDLAKSIESHGLIQPITVMRDKKNKNGFVVVAGERRFRAYQLLKRAMISAVVTSGNADEIALIENLQRENLNAIEEAAALQQLKKHHNYNNVELGQTIGKARSTISGILRINDLPKSIKDAVLTSDDVNKSVLLELAKIDDKKEQMKFWKAIKEKGMTVKEARKLKKKVEGKPLDDSMRILSTGKRFVSDMERIIQQGEGKALDQDKYDELLDLYERFTKMLTEVAEQQASS